MEESSFRKRLSVINKVLMKLLKVSGTIRWRLVFMDVVLFILVCVAMILVHPAGIEQYGWPAIFLQTGIGVLLLMIFRFLFGSYRYILRYGGFESYLLLMLSDGCAFIVDYLQNRFLPVPYIRFTLILSIFCINLLICIAGRMIYTSLYQAAVRSRDRDVVNFATRMLKLVGQNNIPVQKETGKKKEARTRAAVFGAGSLGTSLVNDLRVNYSMLVKPVLFIDQDEKKSGRKLLGLDVVTDEDATEEYLKERGITEIIIAITGLGTEKKRAFYDRYTGYGIKVRVYDFPVMMKSGTGKPRLRDFDIEDLMPRKVIEVNNNETRSFYKGKTVLITGGGGSIGSELGRQIAAMKPKRLIVLDFSENPSYDLQQELRFRYKNDLDLCIEIANVCDRKALEKVFAQYRPDVVLHAAAHKHVPLMEHNCCEAVKNNIFGTRNTAELAILYGVKRFVLISTDKAVNPTNVMGATKRVCEMIVRSLSADSAQVFMRARDAGEGDPSVTVSQTDFCAVRFGNVIGSAGSVVPLFRRQIEKGGPVTLTDKRIIRYFMTIPEAASLVLESGAKAHNGELFVLDMGQPVKILDLAENMIRLSGFEPYTEIPIIETGLRPGEKLYEELLIKSEDLSKTDNEMIFIEKDEPLSFTELDERLSALRKAADTEDDKTARDTLKACVPTFRDPEEVNREVK